MDYHCCSSKTEYKPIKNLINICNLCYRERSEYYNIENKSKTICTLCYNKLLEYNINCYLCNIKLIHNFYKDKDNNFICNNCKTFNYEIVTLCKICKKPINDNTKLSSICCNACSYK